MKSMERLNSLEIQPNMVLKYDENTPPPIKVFKCPYLNCPRVFADKEYLHQHMIRDHGEIPNSFLIKPPQSDGYFSKNKISKQNVYATKHTIKTYKAMLDIYLKENAEKRVERNQKRAQVLLEKQKQARTTPAIAVEPPKPKKISFWQSILNKIRRSNA